MEDDYTTNSHYLTYTFLFVGLENVLFLTWEWKGYPIKLTHVPFPCKGSADAFEYLIIPESFIISAASFVV